MTVSTIFLRPGAFGALCIVFCLTGAPGGCTKEAPVKGVPVSNIDTVKNRHTAELMAISGVTGVYVGQTAAGVPCIRVMVVERTREIDERVPRTLEGHPVEIEVGGPIRPMRQ